MSLKNMINSAGELTVLEAVDVQDVPSKLLPRAWFGWRIGSCGAACGASKGNPGRKDNFAGFKV